MNIILAIALTFGTVVAIELAVDRRIPGFAVVLIFLVLHWLVKTLRAPKALGDIPDDTPVDRSSWPLSGPMGFLGSTVGGILFMVPFMLTNMMSVLNPFQLVQIVRQLIGNYRLGQREKRTGDSGVGYRNKADYALPFLGEWLVFNGGVTPKRSHSWDILGQRFALDFVMADGDHRRHGGRGTRTSDYHCYGQEILAAADGEVIRVENRISEAPLVGWGICDFMARNFVGNHVIIRHAEGEYAIYAHLIKGSACVKAGDRVTQGQGIGRCGHTGHSSEPHLHFHLQDSPDFYNGMGLPVRFNNLQIDRHQSPGGHVAAGQRVRNLGFRPDIAAQA